MKKIKNKKKRGSPCFYHLSLILYLLSFPPLPLRMKGAVNFLEPFVGDVGIDLRGGDGGMAEHRLD